MNTLTFTPTVSRQKTSAATTAQPPTIEAMGNTQPSREPSY